MRQTLKRTMAENQDSLRSISKVRPSMRSPKVIELSNAFSASTGDARWPAEGTKSSGAKNPGGQLQSIRHRKTVPQNRVRVHAPLISGMEPCFANAHLAVRSIHVLHQERPRTFVFFLLLLPHPLQKPTIKPGVDVQPARR